MGCLLNRISSARAGSPDSTGLLNRRHYSHKIFLKLNFHLLILLVPKDQILIYYGSDR